MATRSSRWSLLIFAACLVAANLPGGSAGATSSRIKLAPDLRPPTLPFTVRGQGFGPSEVVDLTFDLDLIGTANTDQAGGFTQSVAVPSSATWRGPD